MNMNFDVYFNRSDVSDAIFDLEELKGTGKVSGALDILYDLMAEMPEDREED